MRPNVDIPKPHRKAIHYNAQSNALPPALRSKAKRSIDSVVADSGMSYFPKEQSMNVISKARILTMAGITCAAATFSVPALS